MSAELSSAPAVTTPVRRPARAFAAAAALAAALGITVSTLTASAPADPKSPDGKSGDAKPGDSPTLKSKGKTRESGPVLTGYLGYKEVQEKLKFTAEERQKLADAQKWHKEAEDKLYAEYEGKLRTILGAERWAELTAAVDKIRADASAKRKKKGPDEKPADPSPKPESKPESK